MVLMSTANLLLGSITRWYTGKALALITEFVLPTLAAAEQRGYWLPNESRKLRAALNKHAVAQKVARQAEAFYRALTDNHPRLDHAAYEANRTLTNAWFRINMGMQYGGGRNVLEMAEVIGLLEERIRLAESAGLRMDAQKEVLAQARTFAADFTPVYALLDKLDATRPKPVFTALGLSPTVTATLTEQLKLDVKTLRFPEMEEKWIERKDEKGNAVRVSIIVIKWPKNTQHNASRFAKGNQCHACGHAIRNGFNWVAFLIDDAKGIPHSFWVGRDCAKNIFNVDVKGDVEYVASKVTGEV